MMNTDESDPYFDDEDEENEEIYRQLLKKRETLPTCASTVTPVFSISERCTLCSRQEAEILLKSHTDVRLGNFILRPSSDLNHPYALSVLSDRDTVIHFQIGQTLKKYVIGPLNAIDLSKAKTFSSIMELLEYYLTSPIIFHETNEKHFIQLQLYSPLEITRF